MTRINKEKNNKKPAKPVDPHSRDDNEVPCVFCGETFAKSKPRDKLIRCQMCATWAHVECTAGEREFVCPECGDDN